MEVRDWISVGTLIAGLSAFFVGLFQYRKAQQWKRAEFIAGQMKEFSSDKMIKNVKIMLDYNSNSVEFFPEHIDQKLRWLPFDDKDLCTSLVRHDDRPKGFTDKEAAIIDHFDHFLDKITEFNHFIELGLVKESILLPYLSYWIDIIANDANDRKSKEFRQIFRGYIDYYGYHGVQRFFKRYGYDIKPR